MSTNWPEEGGRPGARHPRSGAIATPVRFLLGGVLVLVLATPAAVSAAVADGARRGVAVGPAHPLSPAPSVAASLAAGSSAVGSREPATLVYTKSALTGGRPAEEGIWAMGADGSDPHQLLAVTDPGAAALSPDGTHVAVARSGSDTIEVANLLGTGSASFTVPDPGGAGVVSLRWSPVGNLLAYSVVGTGGALVAYTVGSDGSGPRRVATPGGNPSWSPDGGELVVDNAGWFDNSTAGGLFVVDLASGGERPILSQPGSPGAPVQPAWSPSGATIAFEGTGGLSTVGAQGGPVTDLGAPASGAPVWSGDSTALAYGETLNGDTVSIFTVGVAGPTPPGPGTDIDVGNVGYDDTPVAFLPSDGGSDGACSAVLPTGSVVGMAPTADAQGYVITDDHGDVAACGDARARGSASGLALAAPVVGVTVDPTTDGYWLLAADGGVFAFGAPFFGSAASFRLDRSAVGMTATADGDGYWVAAADGGVFAFGDARFAGSLGGRPLAAPIVGVTADPTTGGYWLLAADGGVFAFGAPFAGSMGTRPLAAPVVGGDAGAAGYCLVGADGGVFSFEVAYRGGMAGRPLAAPIVGVTADPATGGYWLLAADGGVFAFGAPFVGSAAAA